jgi:hypothetical protein
MSELYSDFDLEHIKKNIDNVIQKINNVVIEKYDPTKKEITEVQKIILKFAKEKKRKMYGGYGLHLAIKTKTPTGSFYSDEELYSKDIDLYSPEPLKDLVEIADILHAKGYKNIYAREALHSETYTIEVNKRPYCDFSYVPKNVYHRIPFIEVDGYIVCSPYFMEIDYLRMFTDPILSSYRWEKSFDRFYLLQKYYPIRLSKNPIQVSESIPKNIYDILENYLKNNKSMIVSGFRAYNEYVKISKINKNYIKELKIPFFEMTSTDYENDVKQIIEKLQDVDKDKVSIIEYYPFFVFTNFHTDILFDGKLVARVYERLHNLCSSYVQSNGITFGSFHYNLRLCLMNAMYERVNEHKENEKMYYEMASHITQMRKLYFNETEKTLFEDSIFKDFVIECMGETKSDKILHAEEMKKNKRVTFRYSPEDNKTIDLTRWVFANSSGNKIHNQKNYKIKFDENNDIHLQESKNEDETEPEKN